MTPVDQTRYTLVVVAEADDLNTRAVLDGFTTPPEGDWIARAENEVSALFAWTFGQMPDVVRSSVSERAATPEEVGHHG